MIINDLIDNFRFNAIENKDWMNGENNERMAMIKWKNLLKSE
jgi:hypothetical protein